MCVQMSKFRGGLLLESMVAICIGVMVVPVIYRVMEAIYSVGGDLVWQMNHRVESIERYYRLVEDSALIERQGSGCCFETGTHDICYSIVNGRFRRQKKLLISTRYYTHYMGGYDDLSELVCNVDNQQLEISFYSGDDVVYYQFYMSVWGG